MAQGDSVIAHFAPYLYAGIVWGILGGFLTLLFLKMFTFAVRRGPPIVLLPPDRSTFEEEDD
jgi:hypothetical protein